jgi:hypothetical protein
MSLVLFHILLPLLGGTEPIPPASVPEFVSSDVNSCISALENPLFESPDIRDNSESDETEEAWLPRARPLALDQCSFPLQIATLPIRPMTTGRHLPPRSPPL